ncbi:MAG: peptidase C39 family protein [Candidatus Paceibacterota bacterium]|jgi:predicted double-glycine peptidase
MKLKVPFFKQDTPYTCGPASLQMALDFFGVFEGEKRLAKELHTDNEEGTQPKWMMEAAEKRGFHCYEEINATLDDACFFLERKLPVIVYFLEPSENEIHYSIITGIEKGTVTLNDPWNGEGYRMSEQEFIGRWHCKDGRHERWLMAISPEPIIVE